MTTSRFLASLLPLAAAVILVQSAACRDPVKPVVPQDAPTPQAASVPTASADPGLPAVPTPTPGIAPAPSPPSPPSPPTPAVPLPAPVAAAAAAASWTEIKDDPYERRSDFVAGVGHMAATSDTQIEQLNARRATLPQTSVQDWDIAMKELTAARSDLEFKITQLGNATPETWSQAKEAAGTAWQRVQDAYDKVTKSTTTL